MLEINKIYLDDNLELLKQLDDNSIHSCVSDFPYNLSFMNKEWDIISNYYDWCYTRAKELLRVLKPGAYCLIFGGTRTHHRLVCAFEDAGFEIKDELQWIYGQGFPKSYNISKGFNKKSEKDLAKKWQGWETALKPAQEPIMLAQKRIEKNYCYNIKKYGVGALNIDLCRIKFAENDDKRINKNYKHHSKAGLKIGEHKDNCNGEIQKLHNIKGRYPANLIFDEYASEILDEQSEILKSGINCIRTKDGSFLEHGGLGKAGDMGGASRFFYCAKATKKERTENNMVDNKHPTVKPIELIKYLIKLITPANGICIDICEGSGTHARAIQSLNKEGFNYNYIGFEKDEENFKISCDRIQLGE